ncbi:MAG: glycosyltransferase [Candidatus Bathyarchaeia archaeon]
MSNYEKMFHRVHKAPLIDCNASSKFLKLIMDLKFLSIIFIILLLIEKGLTLQFLYLGFNSFYFNLDLCFLMNKLNFLFGHSNCILNMWSFNLNKNSLELLLENNFDNIEHSFPQLKTAFLSMVGGYNISIIIPSLNEERYIKKCLLSLLNQSYDKDYEIIVVDGGSTDKTIDIAKKFADKVIVSSRPVGKARNSGARIAKGNIYAFIDADTIASREWLSTIEKSLIGQKEVAGVLGPTLPYDGCAWDHISYKIATCWLQKFSLMLRFPHVAGFNCAYKKDPFWKAGGFDEKRTLSEDVMLSFKIREFGRIIFNDEMKAYTSTRRAKNSGYLYLTMFYLLNWINFVLFKKTFDYPIVR